MATTDVLGYGVLAVDDMIYVDSYPPPDGKVQVRGRRRQGGGVVSCALVTAARLGAGAAALRRLGDDELSVFARTHMSVAGVDLSRVVHQPDAGPVWCTIVVAADTGKRSIYSDSSMVRPLEPNELRPRWFDGAKVLLVDHMHPPGVVAAARLAKERGASVVSDIERKAAWLPEVRQSIDHWVSSAEFALPNTGCDDAAEACAAMIGTGWHRTVVVTAGEHGCFWCTADDPRPRHEPAFDVKPVDTTGCGDVPRGLLLRPLAGLGDGPDRPLRDGGLGGEGDTHRRLGGNADAGGSRANSRRRPAPIVAFFPP
jgi:sulfofructose kinase